MFSEHRAVKRVVSGSRGPLSLGVLACVAALSLLSACDTSWFTTSTLEEKQAPPEGLITSPTPLPQVPHLTLLCKWRVSDSVPLGTDVNLLGPFPFHASLDPKWL